MMAIFVAGIVFGVLLTSCADRIRGIRTVRYRVELDADRPRAPAQRLEVEAPRRRAPSRPRPPETKSDDTQTTVVAALVGAGYSRDIALKAAAACASNERVTVENWTRAALRHALTQ